MYLAQFYVTSIMWFPITCFLISRGIDTLFSKKIKSLKHILIWTNPIYGPLSMLGIGQKTFLQRNCSVNNCFVTQNFSFYNNVSDFNMIIYEFFNYNANLPHVRLPQQIYVFSSMESPANFPVCLNQLNGFFNWTWTYKLKSNYSLGYMIIKDKAGNVIGPNYDMKWEKIENMKPIDEALKAKLAGKRKAAAWFVSNCKARNNRRQVASEIKDELEKHGMTLDVYGICGWMTCDSYEQCGSLLDKDYYFYLAFENSFSEDYVTEKLLRALKYYAVPVVYGGANYTRFMPDGIYLNARKFDVEDLVERMVYLINNKEQYYNYFRWHNHYSYHSPTEFPETDPYCNLCAALNKDTSSKIVSSYEHFVDWWNEPGTCI